MPTKTKAAPAEESTRENKGFDKTFAKKVVQMKSGGMSVPDIIEKTGESKGSVLMGLIVGKLKPADFVEFSPKEVTRLRLKENLSWGEIAARTLTPEGRVRSAYQEATGKDHRGDRVAGKGGRTLTNGATKAAPAKKAAKATKAKKAIKAGKGSKAIEQGTPAPTIAVKNLTEMTLDELKERLEGKKITTGRAAKTERIDVKSIKKVSGTELTFVETKSGKTRTVDLLNVIKASR